MTWRCAVIVEFTVLAPIMLGLLVLSIDATRAFTLIGREHAQVEAAAFAGARELNGHPVGGYGKAIESARAVCAANSPADSLTLDFGCDVHVLRGLPDDLADGDADARYVSVSASASMKTLIAVGAPFRMSAKAVD
jgi:hypothetical protein